MVSKRKTETGNIERSAREAGRAAASAATPKAETLKAGRKPQKGELLSIRIDPMDKEMLRDTFNQCGVTLAGGIKLSSLFVLQELKAGRLTMTKAGLFPGNR
jgi:hypothetical protein